MTVGTPLSPRVSRLAYGAGLTLLLAALVLVIGCDTSGTSIYDEDPALRPDPQVSGIEPPNSAFAGVGTVTINGSNFSSVPDSNLVYFDGTQALVLEASPSRLVVESPNLPKEGIRVKVAVVGAENFSNEVSYTLEAAVEEFGGVADFEEPFAMTSDAEGNLYVSMFANGASVGIQQVTPDGTRSAFIDSDFPWNALAFKDDGYIYGVRGVRAVFRFPIDGGPRENWAILSDNSARLQALAFDDAGNAWTAGRGTETIYRIDPVDDVSADNIATFGFAPDVRALAVFDGALYAAGTDEQGGGVWRIPISGDALGTPERFFSFPESAGPVEPLALAFAANGDLFVGTDVDDPVWLVMPDGTGAPYFPGLLTPPARSLAWGTGTNLFMSQGDSEAAEGRIIRISAQRERVP
jgi:hypothetical protein